VESKILLPTFLVPASTNTAGLSNLFNNPVLYVLHRQFYRARGTPGNSTKTRPCIGETYTGVCKMVGRDGLEPSTSRLSYHFGFCRPLQVRGLDYAITFAMTRLGGVIIVSARFQEFLLGLRSALGRSFKSKTVH
jgi:hypothetical protein